MATKAKATVAANLAVMARRQRRHDGEKELQRPPPFPRLHRTFQRTEVFLNWALVSNVQGAPHEVVGDPSGVGLDFDTLVAVVLNVEVGTGAADSGATLLVVGMKCWKDWFRLPWFRAHEAEIKYDRTRPKSSMTSAINFFVSVVARRVPQRFVFLFL